MDGLIAGVDAAFVTGWRLKAGSWKLLNNSSLKVLVGLRAVWKESAF